MSREHDRAAAGPNPRQPPSRVEYTPPRAPDPRWREERDDMDRVWWALRYVEPTPTDGRCSMAVVDRLGWRVITVEVDGSLTLLTKGPPSFGLELGAYPLTPAQSEIADKLAAEDGWAFVSAMSLLGEMVEDDERRAAP